jgi:phenylalanyl-tRNA synthetase alpha chain
VLDKLAALECAGLDELSTLGEGQDAEAALPVLDAWRRRYLLGINDLLRGIKELPSDERPRAGQAGNQTRQRLEAAFVARQDALRTAALNRTLAADAVDVTLPGREPLLGRLHPLTLTLRDILRAFASMGFRAVEGPEVEWDYYNFQALNIPPDHPARDMWDTFWIGGDELLRTHTSPMQVRVLEATKPPVRVVVPGRCYRYESVDASHEYSFHQVEGLMVDERCTMAELYGTLSEFARQLFGADRKTRFRCDYFPFVEPGAEMSIDCFVCGGAGCALCKQSGWIEILGAGMVHPNVLRAAHLDPHQYKGFDFGMGVERVAMIRYGVEDIRLFQHNDPRFLRGFDHAAPAPAGWSETRPA